MWPSLAASNSAGAGFTQHEGMGFEKVNGSIQGWHFIEWIWPKYKSNDWHFAKQQAQNSRESKKRKAKGRESFHDGLYLCSMITQPTLCLPEEKSFLGNLNSKQESCLDPLPSSSNHPSKLPTRVTAPKVGNCANYQSRFTNPVR